MAKLTYYTDPELKAEVSFADSEGKPLVLSFGADGFLAVESTEPAISILDGLADAPGHPIQHGDAPDVKKRPTKAEEV